MKLDDLQEIFTSLNQDEVRYLVVGGVVVVLHGYGRMTVLNLHSDNFPETPVDLFATEPFPFDPVYDQSVHETLEDGTAFQFVDLQTLLDMKHAAGRDKDLSDIYQLRHVIDEGTS